MNFAEILSKMNQTYFNTKRLPTEIKVNSHWFEKQLQQTFILKKEGENPLEKLTGVPVHIDDSVDAFEFVYKESE